MTQLNIPAAPALPQSQQPYDEFNSKTDAFLRWLGQDLVPNLNTFIQQLNNFATSATSSAEIVIGTGLLSISVEANKGFFPGMNFKLVSIADPTKWMAGEIQEYNVLTGLVSLLVVGKQGNGTFTGWRLFMAAIEQLDSEYLNKLPLAESVAFDHFLAVSGPDHITKRVRVADVRAPVGQYMFWGGSTPPEDYLAVMTAAYTLSRATYPALHARVAAWGYPWGAGDGVNTFGGPWAPPNYAPVQANGNVNTLTVGEVIAHSHSYVTPSGSPAAYASMSSNSGPTASTTGVTGGSANFPAGFRLLICIKYR